MIQDPISLFIFRQAVVLSEFPLEPCGRRKSINKAFAALQAKRRQNLISVRRESIDSSSIN